MQCKSQHKITQTLNGQVPVISSWQEQLAYVCTELGHFRQLNFHLIVAKNGLQIYGSGIINFTHEKYIVQNTKFLPL